MADSPSVCILGAAGDTSNLGVNALLESTVVGLRSVMVDVSITMFDNGLGRREAVIEGPAGPIGVERLGIRSSKRIQRPESLANMAVAARLRVLPNLGVRRLRDSDVVLDLSGGDSFSDIYGPARFRAITRQKSVALATGSPLVLLPQTYGPFAHDSNRKIAEGLVERATMAWARDDDSYDVLKGLLGSDFDESRHRVSVDVAFALPCRRPSALDPDIDAWLAGPTPVFGVNISGLLANDDASDREFGLQANHPALVSTMLECLLNDTDASILLVPHVRSDLWVVESDIAACRRFAQQLEPRYPGRVKVLEDIDQAQEVKWVIGQCDAFCGTRMHSVIAALSTCTPAMALAYSPKTSGVLASCGQGGRVADLRSVGSREVADRVVALWRERSHVAEELCTDMPAVVVRSRQPFDAVASLIGSGRRGPERTASRT